MLLHLRRGFKCLLCFGWKKIWSKHWDLRCCQNYRNPPLINSQRQILIFSEPTFTFSNKLSLQQKAGGGDDPNTSEGTKLFSTITSNHIHLIHHPFSLTVKVYTFSSRCWQSKNDLSRTQRWIWWTHYENWVVTVVRRIDDQLWSFFRSATLVRAVTTVGRIVPNMFSTGPRGLNWGQTSAAGYFFYPNFIMVMIIIIRVTVLTSWRPSQRPAISLTVFTMQTGIKGLSSKNWILEMIKIFSSHYGKY